MCLRAACRYNNSDQSLTLSSGFKLYKTQLYQISHHGVSLLMAPIFEFAKSISKLDLDNAEVAMLAAVLLMQSGMYVIDRKLSAQWINVPIVQPHCCSYTYHVNLTVPASVCCVATLPMQNKQAINIFLWCGCPLRVDFASQWYATTFLTSDRTGLKKCNEVERCQETILGAFNRYVCEQRKHSLGRWATILMKVGVLAHGLDGK